MNPLFLVSAAVLFLLGIAHCLFGEKLLLMPLGREKAVVLFREKPYMLNVMRFAWHITSVAWWGMAFVLLDFAKMESPSPFSIHAMAGTFTATGIIILGFSRGLHPAWLFFLIMAGCLWAGL